MASDKDDAKKSSSAGKILMWSGIGILVLVALLVLYFRFIRTSAANAAAPPAVAANAAA